jgi:hypothetical protein
MRLREDLPSDALRKDTYRRNINCTESEYCRSLQDHPLRCSVTNSPLATVATPYVSKFSSAFNRDHEALNNMTTNKISYFSISQLFSD